MWYHAFFWNYVNKQFQAYLYKLKFNKHNYYCECCQTMPISLTLPIQLWHGRVRGISIFPDPQQIFCSSEQKLCSYFSNSLLVIILFNHHSSRNCFQCFLKLHFVLLHWHTDVTTEHIKTDMIIIIRFTLYSLLMWFATLAWYMCCNEVKIDKNFQQ
jgi:hypothetical protein